MTAPIPINRGRPRPVLFTWSGEVMIPNGRFMALCGRQFVVGEDYPLIVVENRDMRSHRAYFASVHAGWENLDERYAAAYPSSEHLRKWALVEAGFCAHSKQEFDTPKDAKHAALLLRRIDEFAVIRIIGRTLNIYTAQSQAVPSMSPERFKESKIAVLDIIAAMANTTAAELRREGARNAPPPRKHPIAAKDQTGERR